MQVGFIDTRDVQTGNKSHMKTWQCKPPYKFRGKEYIRFEGVGFIPKSDMIKCMAKCGANVDAMEDTIYSRCVYTVGYISTNNRTAYGKKIHDRGRIRVHVTNQRTEELEEGEIEEEYNNVFNFYVRDGRIDGYMEQPCGAMREWKSKSEREEDKARVQERKLERLLGKCKDRDISVSKKLSKISIEDQVKIVSSLLHSQKK